MAWRFGPKGATFLRLDGDTNRINREMDSRAFNAPVRPPSPPLPFQALFPVDRSARMYCLSNVV